jgi:hypothetical protein
MTTKSNGTQSAHKGKRRGLHCISGTGTKSHLTHVVKNMLHNYPLLASLEAYLAHHVSKNGEVYFTHEKQNMLHM